MNMIKIEVTEIQRPIIIVLKRLTKFSNYSKFKIYYDNDYCEFTCILNIIGSYWRIFVKKKHLLS